MKLTYSQLPKLTKQAVDTIINSLDDVLYVDRNKWFLTSKIRIKSYIDRVDKMPVKGWIKGIKHHKLLTTDILLELAPYILGGKNE